jgi:hypothetical protein
MAQAGFTSLQIYHSTTVAATPSSGNLVAGELAINITDGKLFYEDNLGAVQVIAAKLPTAGLAYSSGSAWSPYSTSGTGTVVALTTSPTFTTPILGVATATSINGVTISATGGTAALNIANTRSFTVQRTLTLTGTDATTMTFPATDATIARTDAGQTFTGDQTITGAVTAFSATAIPAGGTTGSGLKVSSTANFGVFFGSGAPTLSAAKGSLYLRSDGTTTNDRAYINTDSGTTWTALTTVA